MSDEIVAGSSPAPSTGSESAPASAISTPASGTDVQASSVATGEPPRERWDSILSNARAKARQEADAEWQQKFQPYQRFETDSWGAVSEWLDRAENHSIYGPLVKQRYQTRSQPTQQAVEPVPDVPIVDGNGNITGKTYSAERLKEWQRWNDTQTQAKYDARLSPIENHFKQQQQREQLSRLNEQSKQQATRTLTELRQQPYFTAHEKDIAQALFEHKEWGANVHQAYNHVLVTKILPNLSTAERQSVITTLQQQGSATTVAPSGTAVGTPKFKSFATAARYYSEHPEEAQAMANRR